MIIRKAELRDLPAIVAMFYKLTDWLESCGQKLYARDRARFENGVVLFITTKIFREDSLVLVGTDEKDDAVSFLIGGLREMDPFFEYCLICEIQWVFPFNLSVRQLERVFEKWGIEKGATAISNYSTPGNDRVEKVFYHEGREKAWHYFVKRLSALDK